MVGTIIHVMTRPESARGKNTCVNGVNIAVRDIKR
jgi:hypothetical protein